MLDLQSVRDVASPVLSINIQLRNAELCKAPGEYVTSHLGQLSLAIPSWTGATSTSQSAVTPCGWVKAVLVRVWVAGKTV